MSFSSDNEEVAANITTVSARNISKECGSAVGRAPNRERMFANSARKIKKTILSVRTKHAYMEAFAHRIFLFAERCYEKTLGSSFTEGHARAQSTMLRTSDRTTFICPLKRILLQLKIFTEARGFGCIRSLDCARSDCDMSHIAYQGRNKGQSRYS
eukprot:IDg3130t1